MRCLPGSSGGALCTDPGLTCSGDFGIGLFGHLSLSASYLVWGGQGWECFLCTLRPELLAPRPAAGGGPHGWVVFGSGPQAALQTLLARLGRTRAWAPVAMSPADAVLKRVYIEPWGVYVTVQGGTIHSLLFDGRLWHLRLRRHPAGTGSAPQLSVRWEHCSVSRPRGAQLVVLDSVGVQHISRVHGDCSGQ